MAKRIPPHKVEEIFNAVDIVEVVGEYLELKKRGSNYFALSPFKNEKTPSFAISPSKNIFKDFSSGKGGNAVTFLMEVEGMTYVESLKHLAEKYNIELDLEEVDVDPGLKDRRESLYILNKFAARYFNRQLMEVDAHRAVALAYFRERGILESTIETFQLGYSPDQWTAFTNEAQLNQYKDEFLEATGLSYRSSRDNNLLDRFKGRIMFPILDHLGRVCGFGGRILGKKDKVAKYVNSPESEIYHKSNILYGLYHGKNEIRNEDLCILVEGYMDVIALYQAGIKNVVASSGTALTIEQIRLIKRFSKNVLLIYDSDTAGINAALRGLDLMLEQDMGIKVLLLPEGEDPDSYVKANGKNGFESYRKEEAKDFLDFKISHLLNTRDLNDPQEKTQIIHDTASTLARIPDQVRLSVYLDLAADRLKVERDVLRGALGKAFQQKSRLDARQAQTQERKAEKEEKESVAGTSLAQGDAQELELLRLMVNHAAEEVNGEGEDVLKLESESLNLIAFMEDELDGQSFDTPLLENYKNMIFREYEETGKVNVNQLLAHEDATLRELSQRLLTIPIEVSPQWSNFDIKAPNIDENLNFAVYSALMHFKLRKVRQLLVENQKQLKANTDVSKMDHYLRIHVHLMELKREICIELGITID